MSGMHLVSKIDADVTTKEVMKKGYGRGLVEAGKQDESVVAASSDVVSSTGTDAFATEFPDRFFEVGIAEQNLVALGSGLAAIKSRLFRGTPENRASANSRMGHGSGMTLVTCRRNSGDPTMIDRYDSLIVISMHRRRRGADAA